MGRSRRPPTHFLIWRSTMTVPQDLATSRSDVFRYGEWDWNSRTRTLRCDYHVAGLRFEERITLEDGSAQATGAQAAANLVFLLAGISYYKAFAPRVIDLGDTPVSPALRR